ncbi:MAG: SoxR reducing system RseC family protein [Clostridiales bacterium]|jgi:sigma-E factor negative regulatory protein RseC|nr:SoxR reducing system RseC family protein [Clostridiales bacterium]
MVERGTIVKLKKDKAVVSFDRHSACDKCRMCVVSKGGMKVEILIKNTLDKNVGDTVSVEMGNKYVMTAALIVYVIPLILVAVGLICGKSAGETVQIILACAGLVLGFAIGVVLDSALKKIKGFSPVMIGDEDSAGGAGLPNGTELYRADPAAYYGSEAGNDGEADERG